MTMMYSVVDIAGINRISARILANAAGAIAGMATREPCRTRGDERPLVAATMFGVTTPCVTRARERLEELGYEVLVFHATGTGGQAMEALATGRLHRRRRSTSRRPSWPTSSSAACSRPGPDRLEAAGARGRPAGRLARRARHGQLRPARHRARAVRGPQPLRPQPDGHADAHDAGGDAPSSGAGSPRKLNGATGPTVLFVPLRGVSAIDVDGQPFHDRRPTRRCSPRCARASTRRRSSCRGRRDVNDPAFATAMADRLHELIGSARRDDATRRSPGCARRSRTGRPIIGAGAGTGLSAKCAEDGGADLIIIYNSGRFRMAGRGSLSGMMPYGDANAIVMDMAREVLPVVTRHAGAGRRLRDRPVPPHAAVPRGRRSARASPACRTSRPSG